MEKVGYDIGVNAKKKFDNEFKKSPFDIQTTSNFYDESISKKTDEGNQSPYSNLYQNSRYNTKNNKKDKSRMVFPKGSDIYNTMNSLLSDSNVYNNQSQQ